MKIIEKEINVKHTQGGKLVIDYSYSLDGWCVYETTGGTTMKRRSFVMQNQSLADEMATKWRRDWECGMVPNYDLA